MQWNNDITSDLFPAINARETGRSASSVKIASSRGMDDSRLLLVTADSAASSGGLHRCRITYGCIETWWCKTIRHYGNVAFLHSNILFSIPPKQRIEEEGMKSQTRRKANHRIPAILHKTDSFTSELNERQTTYQALTDTSGPTDPSSQRTTSLTQQAWRTSDLICYKFPLVPVTSLRP